MHIIELHNTHVKYQLVDMVPSQVRIFMTFFFCGIGIYAYVKNVPFQVKLRSYRTIQQHNPMICCNLQVLFRRMKLEQIGSLPTMGYNKEEIIFNQIQKLIATNNKNKSGRRGPKVSNSTLNGGKTSPTYKKISGFSNRLVWLFIWWKIKITEYNMANLRQLMSSPCLY